MNTPAHAIVNALILGRRQQPQYLLPIFIGSLLPDASITLFYAWARLRGYPEDIIWNTLYYDPGWHLYFDIPHALPVTGTLGLLLWRLRKTGWSLLFTAMSLHGLFDLPLHHADAHRHLWPFSDWRFASPVSYWDPRHFGQWFSLFEMTLVAFGTAILWRRYPQRAQRGLIGSMALLYILYIWFVTRMWM